MILGTSRSTPSGWPTSEAGVLPEIKGVLVGEPSRSLIAMTRSNSDKRVHNRICCRATDMAKEWGQVVQNSISVESTRVCSAHVFSTRIADTTAIHVR